VYHIYEKTNAKNRAELLCRRVRMSAIADQLRISRRTVESHAVHIYRKLHVANREDLIRDIAGEPR
jgi:DNA-binding CsgD family transcriptional regulator